jgi:hypothetical protein
VTHDAHPAYAAADELLLYLVRNGDTRAYDILWQRHEQAAQSMARCLVAADGADDVVAETYNRVLGVTLRGGGPTDAFRLYLLTALRWVSYERQHERRTRMPADPRGLPGPFDPVIDPSMAGLQTSMVVRAFRALPDCWIAVLWHTEIEQTNPAELGLILGATPGELATLRSCAWEGLRQAYLREYIADGARPECQPVASRLADFVEGAAGDRDGAMVTEHLNYCDDCHAACAELTDIDVAVRTLVTPVFLGSAAASYLSAEYAAAGQTGATQTVPGQTGLAGAAAGQQKTARAPGMSAVLARLRHAQARARRLPARVRHAAGQPWHASKPLLWAAAAAVFVIALVAALALAPAGRVTPQGRSEQQALAPPPAPARTTPSATPAPTRTHPAATPSVSPSPAAPGSPAASPAPGPSTAPDVQLSVTAEVGVCFAVGTANEISWSVADTGSAATGDLTVSVTLPPGVSPQSENEYQEECDPDATGSGCQLTASGVTCLYEGISAGTQAEAAIIVLFDSIADCGQPVDVTVSSGGASASTEAPGGINCSEEGV